MENALENAKEKETNKQRANKTAFIDRSLVKDQKREDDFSIHIFS